MDSMSWVIIHLVRQITARKAQSCIGSTSYTHIPSLCNSGQLCLDTGGDSVLVPTILAASDDPVSSDSVLSFKAGAYSSYILFDDGTVE